MSFRVRRSSPPLVKRSLHVASVIGWGGRECDAAGGVATNFLLFLLHLPGWF
jgi:hypothetical protein